ncbi:endonuclease/exonuclease/phosphatase family metal-dependent hydrolase [Constrictibacter sp. MBR-5]|uniref:endonuclease/exonuclease/phosphatase family protein n=1 Tax=Constrictibacter sp. MBR-5 TaxID=3156467 RepID=UPI003398FD04
MTDKGLRTIRLMSWNIHGCAGSDGLRDADRIVALIDEIGPDVLAVQEVDTRCTGAGGEALVALLADAVGEHRAEAYTLVEPDGEYGQALFSRLPLFEHTTHDVSWRRREPRRVIDVTVAAAGSRLRVLATHLGLSLRERRFQAERLDQALGPRVDVPTVVLGDFNDWLPYGTVYRRLIPRLPVVTDIRTFPARLPLLTLDRIYASSELQLLAPRTLRHARRASDHLPVIADLVLPEARDTGAELSASSGPEWATAPSPSASHRR